MPTASSLRYSLKTFVRRTKTSIRQYMGKLKSSRFSKAGSRTDATNCRPRMTIEVVAPPTEPPPSLPEVRRVSTEEYEDMSKTLTGVFEARCKYPNKKKTSICTLSSQPSFELTDEEIAEGTVVLKSYVAKPYVGNPRLIDAKDLIKMTPSSNKQDEKPPSEDGAGELDDDDLETLDRFCQIFGLWSVVMVEAHKQHVLHRYRGIKDKQILKCVIESMTGLYHAMLKDYDDTFNRAKKLTGIDKGEFSFTDEAKTIRSCFYELTDDFKARRRLHRF